MVSLKDHGFEYNYNQEENLNGLWLRHIIDASLTETFYHRGRGSGYLEICGVHVLFPLEEIMESHVRL